MEFQEFIKNYKRMCSSYEDDCSRCPIYEERPQEDSCFEFCLNFPTSAENAVAKWVAEHPILTNRNKFIEIFGNKMSCADQVRNVLVNMSNGEKYTDDFIKTVIVHYDNWLNAEYESPGNK